MTEKKPFIAHSKPMLGDEEAQAAAAVVASGHIAEGPQVEAFERELARFIGVAHAVCASSGTAALHLALAAMGVGPGDEVVVPSFVCSALLNAVTVTGASPVMAEIDPVSLNLDPQDVERRLTLRTKAVVVPHMFGLPADPIGCSLSVYRSSRTAPRPSGRAIAAVPWGPMARPRYSPSMPPRCWPRGRAACLRPVRVSWRRRCAT